MSVNCGKRALRYNCVLTKVDCDEWRPVDQFEEHLLADFLDGVVQFTVVVANQPLKQADLILQIACEQKCISSISSK